MRLTLFWPNSGGTQKVTNFECPWKAVDLLLPSGQQTVSDDDSVVRHGVPVSVLRLKDFRSHHAQRRRGVRSVSDVLDVPNGLDNILLPVIRREDNNLNERDLWICRWESHHKDVRNHAQRPVHTASGSQFVCKFANPLMLLFIQCFPRGAPLFVWTLPFLCEQGLNFWNVEFLRIEERANYWQHVGINVESTSDKCWGRILSERCWTIWQQRLSSGLDALQMRLQSVWRNPERWGIAPGGWNRKRRTRRRHPPLRRNLHGGENGRHIKWET